MARTRELKVKITGDERDLQQAFGKTSKAANTWGSKLAGFGKIAALGIAGAGVVAVKFGIDFVKAAEDSIKVSKQTLAVLKSTGDTAEGPAANIAELADQLSKKAGIDDELIQSGLNVLLTFTKIRNEVGKGNDIFHQASAVALDMSVALGTDLQGSIIQVGKALNDPIKGITALRRVGVSFSQAQIDMITKLADTGDLLGAQKVILAELTKEFGGSAEAQATASGKLQVAWDNLKETLGMKLLPVMEAFSTWMTEKGIPKIEQFADWIQTKLIPALGDMVRWIRDEVVPKLQTLADWAVTAADGIQAFAGWVNTAAQWLGERLNPALDTLTGLLGDNSEATKSNDSAWKGWAVTLGVVAGGIGLVVAALAPFAVLFKALATGFGFVGFAATQAFSLILRMMPFSHIALAAFLMRDQIVAAFNWVRDRVVEAFTYARQRTVEQWNAIWAGISAVAGKIRDWAVALPGNIRSWMADVGNALYQKGRGIVTGFLRGIADKAGDLKKWFTDLPGNIWDWIGFGSPPQWAIEGGWHIIGGLLEGMDNKIGTVKKWLSEKFGNLLQSAFAAIPILGGSGAASGNSAVALGRQLAQSFGWTGNQWEALYQLWQHESGWNSRARNPSSGAFGIPQALPPGKMGTAAVAGDAQAQIMWGLRYIRDRYGSPLEAWRQWQNRSPHWYETGGVVPGPIGQPQMAVVHGGENILSNEQRKWFAGAGGGDIYVTVDARGALGLDPRALEDAVVGAIGRAGAKGRPIKIRGRTL